MLQWSKDCRSCTCWHVGWRGSGATRGEQACGTKEKLCRGRGTRLLLTLAPTVEVCNLSIKQSPFLFQVQPDTPRTLVHAKPTSLLGRANVALKHCYLYGVRSFVFFVRDTRVSLLGLVGLSKACTHDVRTSRMHLALDFSSIAGTEILFSATFFPSSLRFALEISKGADRCAHRRTRRIDIVVRPRSTRPHSF